MTSRAGAWVLRGLTGLTLAFIYLPLLVIFLYAFNDKRSLVWPIDGLTTKWFGRAVDNPGVRDALLVSHEGGARRDGDSPSCSARWRRWRSPAIGSSGGTRSRSSSSSRSRCPGS